LIVQIKLMPEALLPRLETLMVFSQIATGGWLGGALATGEFE
jgi:hypothetical protein